MGDDEYFVTITNEGDTIYGCLHEIKNGGRQTYFNPLTILGDLLNIVTYTDTSPYSQDNYSFKADYLQHPFFLGDEYKKNTLFKEPYSLRHFFAAVNQLKEIITDSNRFSIGKFEILKQYLSLNFTYKIEFREINPLYKLGYKENSINHEIITEYQYLPLQYTYNYDMDFMFGDNKDTPFKFTYTCYGIEDIVFSVLHYLALFEYKFNKCEHCENYFATKSFKIKYCNRKSPYKGRENLTCGEAVDRIMTFLDKRRNSIKAYLYNSYGDIASEFLYEFSTHKKATKSVKNLEMLEHITSDDYVKQKWYKEKYKNKKG